MCIRDSSAPPTIERKDRERIVTVSAVISGAPLGSVVAVSYTHLIWMR